MRVVLPLLPAWSRWLLVAIIALLILYASVLAPPPAVLVEEGDDGTRSVSVETEPTTYEPDDDDIELFTYLETALGFAANQWRHLLAYAALAYSLADATTHWQLTRTHRAILVLASVILYGGAIEAVQHLTHDRTASGIDLVVNTIGASSVLPWYALDDAIDRRSITDLLRTD